MTADETKAKLFYTVAETAELLRVTTSTLYRAIREDAFPAIRIRGRFVVPAKAIDRLIETALELDGRIDLNDCVAERRTERALAQTHTTSSPR